MKALVKKATELPPRFAFFLTHGANPATTQGAFNLVRRGIEKAGSQMVGEFDCYGECFVPYTMEERIDLFAPEERETARTKIEGARGQPDDQDLANARAFTKSLIG